MKHHWDFPYAMGNPMFAGFLYLIINTEEHRLYIGKKHYTKRGRKKSKTYGHPTAWRTYTSSCIPLKKDITRLGKSKFKFIVLGEFANLTDMHYWENKLIYLTDALLKNNWYNGRVGSVYVIPKSAHHRWRTKDIYAFLKEVENGEESVSSGCTTYAVSQHGVQE
jgi:Putative endonuclease segE, GIY-YIG domain